MKITVVHTKTLERLFTYQGHVPTVGSVIVESVEERHRGLEVKGIEIVVPAEDHHLGRIQSETLILVEPR